MKLWEPIRRAFVLAASLACVGLLAAGAYSYRHGIPEDGLWIEDSVPKIRCDAALIKGIIHVVWSRPCQGQPQENERRLAGFYCRTRTIGNTLAMGAGAPFWAPAALLALCPLWAALHHLRLRRRRRKNLCPACGYPRQGLAAPCCPECGSTEAISCRL